MWWLNKINGQMARRGWDRASMKELIDSPTVRYNVVDLRAGIREPATVYAHSNNTYVMLNNRTGEVIQVSDRSKPGWKPVWESETYQP
jgi:hypothetical protein